MDAARTRVEKDSLGEKEVPVDAYYGVHTVRSLENFHISQKRFQPEWISAIALLKHACADANLGLGLLDRENADAIKEACDEVIAGRFSGQFPLDIFQAGSGTSTNMNVNEVIANRASELLSGSRAKRVVHPNDHVNMGQSTNDIIPSSIRVASVLLLPSLLDSLQSLEGSLSKKSVEFSDVIKSGRTHLQDAVPIALGQEFGAYAAAISKARLRLELASDFLLALSIGGNAVGTGINTRPEFRSLVLRHLNKRTGKPFRQPSSGIEATQFMTDLAGMSFALVCLSIDIGKIANDLRLLSSGPKTGLGEIFLPPVEPGSSIMPGKVNPSICEAVNMACMQAQGNGLAVSNAAAAGQLELNTHMPVIGYNLLEAMGTLAGAVRALDHKCVQGIAANRERCAWYFENSMALATVLNPYIGYDNAASLVKESLRAGKTLKQLVLEKKIMPKEELERLLDPKSLTSPNLTDKGLS